MCTDPPSQYFANKIRVVVEGAWDVARDREIERRERGERERKREDRECV